MPVSTNDTKFSAERQAAVRETTRFIEDAIECAGGAQQLTQLLYELGFEGVDGPYSARAVHAWRTGSNRPAGDMLLALAKRCRLSLDRYALGAELQVEIETLKARISALEAGAA